MVKIEYHSDKKLDGILHKIGEVSSSFHCDVYLVGGSVRDLIMKREVTDLDFVVIGDGIQFASAFAKKNKIKKIVSYKRFGTAMIPFRKYKLEFVSARSEQYEEMSRNPVVKKANLQTDLSRRDFTINTLAVKISPDMDMRVIDTFNGLRDLEEGIIRTPLAAEKTFFDDPLRILRAVRFSAQLNFKIDESTFSAMKKMAGRLAIISVERIADEFRKLLLSAHPAKGLDLLDRCNLLPWTIPELQDLKLNEEKDGFHHKDIFNHTLEVVENIAQVSEDFGLRLAAMLHDIGKPQTKQLDAQKGWTFHGHAEKGAEMVEPILSRLKYANELSHRVKLLVLLHQRPAALTDAGISDSAFRRLLFTAGDLIDDLLILSRADISTRIPGKKEILLQKLSGVEKKLAEIEAKDKLRNFAFPVNGFEIMDKTGVPPGEIIGIIKDEIKEAILDGKLRNDRESVLRYIDEHKDGWLANNE